MQQIQNSDIIKNLKLDSDACLVYDLPTFCDELPFNCGRDFLLIYLEQE